MPFAGPVYGEGYSDIRNAIVNDDATQARLIEDAIRRSMEQAQMAQQAAQANRVFALQSQQGAADHSFRIAQAIQAQHDNALQRRIAQDQFAKNLALQQQKLDLEATINDRKLAMESPQDVKANEYQFRAAADLANQGLLGDLAEIQSKYPTLNPAQHQTLFSQSQEIRRQLKEADDKAKAEAATLNLGNQLDAAILKAKGLWYDANARAGIPAIIKNAGLPEGTEPSEASKRLAEAISLIKSDKGFSSRFTFNPATGQYVPVLQSRNSETPKSPSVSTVSPTTSSSGLPEGAFVRQKSTGKIYKVVNGKLTLWSDNPISSL